MPYILLGKVAHAKYAAELSALGFTPIPLPADERLNKTVASHADTLIYTDLSTYVANDEYISRLPEEVRKFITGTHEYPAGGYSTDTAFNALFINGCVFAKCKSLANDVINSAKSAGHKIINVNQGYAKCSVLALVHASAAITSDVGMTKIMTEHKIRVLPISPGHIALEGCEYGFIGGASFVDESSKTVYFFGNIMPHPDAENIISFIEEAGYSVFSLTGKLSDFGGAVII